MLPHIPVTVCEQSAICWKIRWILRYSPFRISIAQVVCALENSAAVTMREVRTISRKDSDFSSENPQRPYADQLILSQGELKIWSGPYGDVGRPAETTGPPIDCVDRSVYKQQFPAKFLVG